ncbi:hypothetical protein V8D89_000160 [Ganoderma adspersum]
MFFALGSIAGAGLAALSTFKNTLMSGAEKPAVNLHISMKLNSENVTIVSPQPLEVIGAQFDFKFIDMVSLQPDSADSRSLGPLDITLRNKTFQGALFPSKIRFILDSDPPTAEAKILIFTHPGLAEGAYNLSINEWVVDGPFNTPSGFSHFDVPVIFSLYPKVHEDKLAHEEL